MLLICSLGLIAKFTSVSEDCKDGTQDVENFDWSKVRISLLPLFLQQVTFKAGACFIFRFWFH